MIGTPNRFDAAQERIRRRDAAPLPPLWEGLYAPTRLALEPQIHPLARARRTRLARFPAGMRTMRRLEPAKLRGLAVLEIDQRTIGRGIGNSGARTLRN